MHEKILNLNKENKIHINECNLSSRVINRLTSVYNIKYLNELEKLSKKELFRIRNFGIASYKEVITELEKYNLSLREDKNDIIFDLRIHIDYIHHQLGRLKEKISEIKIE